MNTELAQDYQPVEKKKTASDIRYAAMNLLSRREHSIKELRVKLLKKYNDYAEVDSALSRLESEGLLSNERFAESYSRYRRNLGFGPLKIKTELREKGISEDLIQIYCEGMDSQWREELYDLWQRKFSIAWSQAKELEVKEKQKIKSKQLRHLIYKGFSLEDVYSAVPELSH